MCISWEAIWTPLYRCDIRAPRDYPSFPLLAFFKVLVQRDICCLQIKIASIVPFPSKNDWRMGRDMYLNVPQLNNFGFLASGRRRIFNLSHRWSKRQGRLEDRLARSNGTKRWDLFLVRSFRFPTPATPAYLNSSLSADGRRSREREREREMCVCLCVWNENGWSHRNMSKKRKGKSKLTLIRFPPPPILHIPIWKPCRFWELLECRPMDSIKAESVFPTASRKRLCKSGDDLRNM